MRITVGGLKGGIGKTTTAAYLATALSRHGPTLAVDADPQSQSLFDWYQLAVERGYELPWECHPWSTDDLARRVRGIQDRFQHVVIDTGGETARLFRAAVAVAGELVVPVRPNLIELRRLPATFAAAAEVEHINPAVAVYPRVLLVAVNSRTEDAPAAREFLQGQTPPLPMFASNVRASVEYARAFGHVPSRLLDYGPVVDELLAPARAAA